MNVPQQMDIRGMTFDPNNANVRALQAQRPHDWMKVMGASQGLQNAGPQNVQPVSPFAQQHAHMFQGGAGAAQQRLNELQSQGLLNATQDMKAAAFGQMIGNLEKEANPLAKLIPAATSAASKAFAPAIKGFTRATAQGASPAYAAGRAAAGQVMSSSLGRGAVNTAAAVPGAVSSAGKMLANAPEATGKFLTNATRRAGNLIDPAGQAGSKITEFLGANNRAGNFANKVIGGGALAIGANKMLGGGGEEGGGQAGLPPGALNMSATGGARAAGGDAGGGLMGMWNNLPVEARYAIGAGVPLALLGGLAGMRGNTGAGLGLGALGLGAAGLGLAGSGAFGDGARRMVGQGANALYNMVGGGSGGDLRGQLNALKGLSPEFGTTMLMGRDPKLTSEQARGAYDFLTTNPAVESFLPGIENASVRPSAAVKAGALIAKKMAEAERDGRCWKGYEAVPGVKPYSRGSCRPVNAQKDTNSPKPEAAGDEKSDN